MRKSIFIAFALLLVGCGAAPTKHEFNNARIFDASFDSVWDAVIAYFATQNIPIKTIAKDSGVIFAETTALDSASSGFADCGKADIGVVIVANYARFNVYVKRGEARQAVSVNATFAQTRNNNLRHVSGLNFDCTSTGKLETTMLQSIHPQ